MTSIPSCVIWHVHRVFSIFLSCTFNWWNDWALFPFFFFRRETQTIKFLLGNRRHVWHIQSSVPPTHMALTYYIPFSNLALLLYDNNIVSLMLSVWLYCPCFVWVKCSSHPLASGCGLSGTSLSLVYKSWPTHAVANLNLYSAFQHDTISLTVTIVSQF